MKSKWETTNSKRVFFGHYDHLSLEELREEIGAVEAEMLKQPLRSVLFLADTSGTIISPQALNLFKNIALSAKPYVRKIAVLGVTGVRRTMLDAVAKFSGMEFVTFDALQQANEWLVKD